MKKRKPFKRNTYRHCMDCGTRLPDEPRQPGQGRDIPLCNKHDDLFRALMRIKADASRYIRAVQIAVGKVWAREHPEGMSGIEGITRLAKPGELNQRPRAFIDTKGIGIHQITTTLTGRWNDHG